MLNFGQDFGMPANDGPASSDASFILQTIAKDVMRLRIDLDSEVPCFEEENLFSMQHLCIKLQSALLSGKEVVVGLSSNLRLYINGHLFSNECTCFLLTQNFLLFVNSTSGLSHELFMYDLNKPLPVPSS